MTKRIVIVGNSGSGKSHLAQALSEIHQIPVITLDSIFWLPGGFNQKRRAEEVNRLVANERAKPAWITEGVFGNLAAQFLDLADLLIWLDLPWEICRAGLMERGSESSRQRDRIRAEESFEALLFWSSEYWTRNSTCSHFGHQRLFNGFLRPKVQLHNRAEINTFIENSKRLSNESFISHASS